MKRIIGITIQILLLVSLSAYAQSKPIDDLRPTVILLSLDGFRYDYLKKYRPPVLNRLAREGVRAQWMTPSFPSKTFPNHYTIATGLYPQHHGIVENNIYDRGFNAVFTLGTREEVQNGRWWLGEPIWVTAEKQGQRAGTYFFPGTEAEIAGRRPSYWKPYDGKVPNAERVDTVLSWLDLPANERPTFLTLYFSDVDDAGHDFSPDSVETRDAVLKVDKDIARLVDGLTARGIYAKVNIIVVSDHGMATQYPKNVIVLDELFPVEQTERVLWTGEIVSIFPKAGKEEEIYRTLKARLPRQANVYRKGELPARYHYSDSPRIAPILVLPREGWSLSTRARLALMKERGAAARLRGGHGYDNQLASMRAIFIAHGEAFKKGRVVAPFANIHVYNIMTKILGLKPAPNDGNMSAARLVLRR